MLWERGRILPDFGVVVRFLVNYLVVEVVASAEDGRVHQGPSNQH